MNDASRDPNSRRCIVLKKFEQGDGVIEIMHKVGLQIYSLEMHPCRTTASSALSFAGQCQNLRYLTLNGCTGPATMDSLKECSMLKTLCLMRFTGLKSVEGLDRCMRLQSLYLMQCENLDDVAALGLCINLHTLHIEDCTGLTTITALQHCKNLRYINFLWCTGLRHIETEMYNNSFTREKPTMRQIGRLAYSRSL